MFWAHKEAAAALGAIGAPARDALPALEELKKHRRESVREAAAEAEKRIREAIEKAGKPR